MSGKHPFQAVNDELKVAGVRITGSENSHRLLFKLCMHKVMQINGSVTTAARNGNGRRRKVITQAKVLLHEYLKTGLIVLPEHLRAKGSNHKYKRDGNANVNLDLRRAG
jgi:hypothetical protein